MGDSISVKNYKKLTIIAWVVSIAVPVVVAVLSGLDPSIDVNINRAIFPTINATINSCVAICLILSLVAIKKKNIVAHNRFMNIAIALSVLFLLTYVTSRLIFKDALYGDINLDGVVDAAEKASVSSSRGIYLFILITHISLSAIIIPFVSFSYLRGIKAKELGLEYYAKHRKLAKFTFPLWLYVAVTGVAVFFFMKNYY